jgi:hypothetical protein
MEIPALRLLEWRLRPAGCHFGKPDNWASADLNGGGERDNHPSQFSPSVV